MTSVREIVASLDATHVTPMARGMYRNRKLLDCARGLPCQNCGADDGTISPAHSNLSEHGKGKGLKAHDAFWAALCNACHRWLDNQAGPADDPSGVFSAANKREMFLRAMYRTWLELWRRGLVVVR